MQNWEYKKLSDIVTQINGLWKGKKEPFINVAVIRNTNFSKDCQLKLDDVEYLDVEVKQFENRKLKYGDIIIEKSGGSEKQPVGRPILFDITEGNYSFSNFTSTLRIKETSDVSSEYLQQYLYHRWLEGDTRNLQSHTTGIHNLDFKKYLEFVIPLPSLEEQKRIVKILDEKFAQLETVKANAKTNLQNAKDLFQSQLTKAFSNTTWEKKRLYEVCSITSKLVDPTLPEYLDLYHVGGANIESETGIIIDLQTSKEEGLSSGKFTFDDTMVLYNKIRPYLKKVARPDFNGLCSADMYPLSPKTNITKDYLYYILTSNDFTEYAISKSGRAGMPKVNREALFAYECYIPPLSEQKRIVEQLDSLSEKVRSLEEIYTKQLANCDELKQAFLAKAFNGEL